jgi:hypothetical protein
MGYLLARRFVQGGWRFAFAPITTAAKVFVTARECI